MAYYVKYRIDFKDVKENNCRVDILEDLSSQPTILGLTPNTNPVTLQLPDFSNLADRVCGSGISISAVYTGVTMVDIRSLFTIDPHGKKINYYEDIEGENLSLVWTGWLNTEIYDEDFAEYKNKEINLEGNDGLATLDRYDYGYGTNNETHYTGNYTINTILYNIFDQLELISYDLFVACRLNMQGTTGNIIDNIKLQNENYYDESGVAMTMREVLNEICKLLNVYCFISWNSHSYYSHKPSIFLVDFKEMKYASQTPVYQYLKGSGVYTLYQTINDFFQSKALDNTFANLKYMSNKSSLYTKTGVSQLTLTYSGFEWEDYFTNYQWNLEENWISDEFDWVDVDDDEFQYDFSYTENWQGVTGINLTGSTLLGVPVVAAWRGYKENEDTDNDANFFAAWQHVKTTQIIEGITRKSGDGCPRIITDNAPFLLYGTNGQYLKITAQVNFSLHLTLYDDSMIDTMYNNISYAELKCKLHLGPDTIDFYLKKKKNEKGVNFENSFTELSAYVPITSDYNGTISIEILDHLWALYWDGDICAGIDDKINYISLKDIKVIAVTDLNDTLNNDDIKTTGNFDTNYKNKAALKICLGDSTNACMTHRGAVLTLNDTLATNFRRMPEANYYNLNDLNVRLYAAEVQDFRYGLTTSVSSNYLMWGGSNPFNSLTIMTCSQGNLNGKKFMLQNAEYVADEKIIECDFIEVFSDSTVEINI
jgi:hypothetical protein